jgi:uncharacterized membrane protein YozB (DUF420 family)
VDVHDLPTVNASLNFVSAVLLMFGYIKIKQGKRATHKKIMLSALVSSLAFLTTYLIYHSIVGSVPYQHQDWTRPIYFAILIPHVILAGLMVPFIVAAVWFALHDNYEKHKRLVHWVWPVWMFVSVSGIAVYLMLYHL